MEAHNIVHVELAAKDRKSLSKFYSDVFGWDVKHEDGMDYTTFRAGDCIGGGFNPVTEQNPMGTTTIYIQTDDVTASLKSVERAGGTIIVPEAEIPNTGRFGIFRDPQGNMVGLYKPYPMMGQQM